MGRENFGVVKLQRLLPALKALNPDAEPHFHFSESLSEPVERNIDRRCLDHTWSLQALVRAGLAHPQHALYRHQHQNEKPSGLVNFWRAPRLYSVAELILPCGFPRPSESGCIALEARPQDRNPCLRVLFEHWRTTISHISASDVFTIFASFVLNRKFKRMQ